MNEIIILQFNYEDGDNMDTIYPVVIRDKEHVVLVDCGVPNTLHILENVLKENNISPEDITHIIITHHDQDHIGNLFEFKNKYANVKVLASAGEEPYISGKKELERLTHAQSQLDKIDKKDRQSWNDFIELLKTVKPVAVDEVINPNDCLDICGGIEIMDTKGHTSHHISLYLKHMDTIVAGDAAFVNNRRLTTAPEAFTIDMELAKQSLELIENSDARNIICYHGGLYSK